MSIFDKLQPVADVRRRMLQTGVDPLGVPIEQVFDATEGTIDGRRTILAGTNNYLGLTFDSDCIEAAVRATRAEGTGTTGSRMANGTYSGHLALERELAALFDVPDAVVFSTGYQANLGILGALAGPRDTVVLDADCHASIYDGVRLGGAQTLRFRHNDAADLDKRLRRLGDAAHGALVIVEGIYSMLGDRAPLADIAEITQARGAYLLVDEAHSFGVLGGNGRGLAEEVGVERSVDFIVGTFSKSLGATGGFCVSRHPELDLIRYASRAYIFTASPAPSVVASTRTALAQLQARPELRERLWENAHRLYDALHDLGFELGPQTAPVVAAIFEDQEVALTFWQDLLARGVYVNLMLPPATPDGRSLVRVSVSAAHSPAQIEAVIDAFAAARQAADCATSA